MNAPYLPPALPFRKRRPFVFMTLLLLALVVFYAAGATLAGYFDRKGTFSGPRLGLITLEGFIGDVADIVRWTETLRRDPTVAGVLLRIDSPGGAVAPSQELHAAVKRLAEAKPVIVSMGTVAASGGYYVAVAGHEIFANPSTLTGSIGVRVQITNVQSLMERIGVSAQDLTTGTFKGTGSPYKTMTDEEKTYLMELLNDMQGEFVAAVSQGRNLTPEVVAAHADGRVFTGRQALAAKLVDHIGDRQTALQRLKEICRLTDSDPTILTPPEKAKPFWLRMLSTVMELDAARSAEASRYLFVY